MTDAASIQRKRLVRVQSLVIALPDATLRHTPTIAEASINHARGLY
jgi:hypothetical protein